MNLPYLRAYALAMQLKGLFDLPDFVVNAGLKVFRKLVFLKATQGRKRDSLLKACILVACDNLNYPLIIDWRFPHEKKFINRLLGLKHSSVESHMFVSRLSYDLGLTEAQISSAISLVRGLHGLGPACAALTKQGVSIRRLARLSGLSKNYIWRLSKELYS